MFTPKRRLFLAVASSLLLVISGCATMFTPGVQDVPVASTPQGAEVFLDGAFVGVTPVVLEARANEAHEVVVRLGNEERAWVLEPQIGTSGGLGIAGDVLILVPMGLVGIGMIAWGADDTCLFGGSGCADSGLVVAGVVVGAVALTPLVVDVATNQFYELVPKEISAEFE